MTLSYYKVCLRQQNPRANPTIEKYSYILHLRSSGLQVVVPKTYHKYTARKVLTTQWIEGEKLSQSTESDVGELVNVGVICYLKQVITGVASL